MKNGERVRIVRTAGGGYIVRCRRPACLNCGMVNTVNQSGYCVNCHRGGR